MSKKKNCLSICWFHFCWFEFFVVLGYLWQTATSYLEIPLLTTWPCSALLVEDAKKKKTSVLHIQTLEVWSIRKTVKSDNKDRKLPFSIKLISDKCRVGLGFVLFYFVSLFFDKLIKKHVHSTTLVEASHQQIAQCSNQLTWNPEVVGISPPVAGISFWKTC